MLKGNIPRISLETRVVHLRAIETLVAHLSIMANEPLREGQVICNSNRCLIASDIGPYDIQAYARQ